MDLQSFKNFHLLSFGSRCSAASSSAFLSFLLVPASKKNTTQRQAIFCPICVRASQQLVPHFLILALSLNPVHEYSELI
jgi:hypothetical protein